MMMKPAIGSAMGFHLVLFLFLGSFSAFLGQKIEPVTIVINGTQAVSNTDANYICATIDWWPHDKCNYNQCPWAYSSLININLNHPLLAKTIQAFESLRIRIGGSLQDKVLYDVGNLKEPCHPFQRRPGWLFGFTKGCLHMNRWDEVNRFLSKTGAIVTFGLNALYGRYQIREGVWGGVWDSTNAHDFIAYTVSKGYRIDSWEFGNELSGSGVGASVGAEQYGKDLIKLKAIVDALYHNIDTKPLIVAPGGFYDEEWYNKLLQVSGPLVVNVMTHHLYNLGAGNDPDLINRILDPFHLSKVSGTFRNLKRTIEMHGPWTSAWVGESGGAFNSGGRHVSDTFVSSFWYLDQLGMAAKYGTKVYCRQTLVGGNYGLLNTTTFVPNPDYYSALLWHRLMGKGVLAVTTNASPYLRSYAHCSKGRAGVTLLLINLSKQTRFQVSVLDIAYTGNFHTKNNETNNGGRSFTHGLKQTVSYVGNKAGEVFREEYHLTPKHGDLRTKTMLLNGNPLKLTVKGDIPSLEPALVDTTVPISIAPLSIKFIALPNFKAPACWR